MKCYKLDAKHMNIFS